MFVGVESLGGDGTVYEFSDNGLSGGSRSSGNAAELLPYAGNERSSSGPKSKDVSQEMKPELADARDDCGVRSICEFEAEDIDDVGDG